MPKFGALISVRNEEPWIQSCLDMIEPYVDVVSVTRGLKSWTGGFEGLDATKDIVLEHEMARDHRIIYSEVEEPESDEAQRNLCLSHLKEAGCDYVFIVDPDEFWHRDDLALLFARTVDDAPGQVYCWAQAYWRGMGYSCGQEHFGPVMIACRPETSFDYIRAVNQDPGVTWQLMLHHMTAVKTDHQMKEKILGWSHSHEVVDRWLERKWHGWIKDRNIRDLHPVSPGLWPKAVKQSKLHLPAILQEHPWYNRDIVK